MPYEPNPDKLKWTGLWMRENKSNGNKFYASTVLRPEDIEKFIEFCKKPTKIFIFPNSYKTSDNHPDASIHLWHIDENWKPSPKPVENKPEPEPTQPKLEDAPF
jgi:hypothetical protein